MLWAHRSRKRAQPLLSIDGILKLQVGHCMIVHMSESMDYNANDLCSSCLDVEKSIQRLLCDCSRLQ